MYAVIKTGGKQYRVAKGAKLEVEKLAGEAGADIAFSEVLMLGEGEDVTLGAPLVAGASVAGRIVEQKRDDKIIVFKKKRRQNYRRKKGHRQHLTVVEITDILKDGASIAPHEDEPTPAPVEAPETPEIQTFAGAAPAGLEAAEGEADDLTRISGVGPALQEKLNGLGVYHFRQIAEWSEENVAYVDDFLSFKGRIARDDWIGQAKALAAGDNEE